ncbi:fungal-specific transcription factor domain-containing protein [Mycena metata]|uniref:Fungal-specific transcription factor domain-containing protein n=1 Tax=Mycena metata TaxID=1033252 RepID=A0AAD7JAK2_9AGAR|nr:fungal-specific transcription factor domain-containing protein [Mycena metata]
MSSNDDSDAAQSKKRRIQRACDICRVKKIRCDGAQMTVPGRCSNCIAYNLQCSYVEAAKKRGPPKRYVESMEIRVEKIEQLLQTLLPEADLAELAELAGSTVPSWQIPDEDDLGRGLTENLQRLSLNPDRDSRFFGRSSGTMLLQAALDLRVDIEPQNNARRHTEFWASRPSPEIIPPPQYNFPPPDLAASLVDLYFTNSNLLLPLLHRPTFARDLEAGLHLTNDAFAATFLLVCAIGSRFSSDPRVLLDGIDDLHSSGWRWFEQLQLMRDLLGPPPCLYDLQFNALAVIFLRGTSAARACWTLVSIGIRMAQDVGAHRRKAASHPRTAEDAREDELWKRAFWVLTLLDGWLSAYTGRPCSIQDEDFDLDFPIDCDDEFWETAEPERAFQQPKGKPSYISAFIAHLRLHQILSFALRTIYSINNSKVLLGLSKGDDSDWEHRIVVELDSALNKWFDDLPDHLRWNPTNEHLDFFEQSAVLYCSYYHMQIIIHRPYIPSPNKVSAMAFPSLAICLNAARSCSHVADTYRQRMGNRYTVLAQVFTAAIVILLNIWGGKRSGLGFSTDSAQEMAEVQRCMEILRGCEQRWPTAGMMWDVLFDIANVGQLSLPATASAKNKRDRGAEVPKSATASAPYAEGGRDSVSPDGSSGSSHTPAPRAMPGRRWSVIPDRPDMIGPGGSASVPSARPIAGRRLQTSDVPAIMTQFLPHVQHRSPYPPDTPLSTHRSPAYASETPLTSSSLHQQQDRFAPIRGDDPRRPRTYGPGPETPLSTSSIPSHQELIPSMERPDAQHRRHAPSHLLRPPESASSVHSPLPPPFLPSSDESQSPSHGRMPMHPSASIHGHQLHGPYTSSMHNELVQLDERLDYPHSREMLDDRARGRGPEYWYPGQGRTPSGSQTQGEPSPVHLQHRPTDTHPARSSVPEAGRSSSFPMSEAFYDHITASFSAGSGHGHRQAHLGGYEPREYSDVRHQVPSNARVHGRGGEMARPAHGMEEDAMTLWSAAPIGFDMDAPSEWDSYLDTVNEMTQARMRTSGDGRMQ